MTQKKKTHLSTKEENSNSESNHDTLRRRKNITQVVNSPLKNSEIIPNNHNDEKISLNSNQSMDPNDPFCTVFTCQTSFSLHAAFSRLFHFISFFLALTTIFASILSRLILHYHVDPEDPLKKSRPYLVSLLILVGSILQFIISTQYAHEFATRWYLLFNNDSTETSNSSTEQNDTQEFNNQPIEGLHISTKKFLFNIIFITLSLFFIHMQISAYLQHISNAVGHLRGPWWRYYITRPYAMWVLILVPWGFFLIGRFIIKFLFRKISILFGWDHCNTTTNNTTNKTTSSISSKNNSSKKCYFKSIINIFTLALILILPCIALVGLDHTIRAEEIHNTITIKVPKNQSSESFELNLLQLSDIHLGTFMSHNQLQDIIRDALILHPEIDLVALTGDFFTLESTRDTRVLSVGLEPLKKWIDRRPISFACPGNHDHDVLSETKREIILSDTEFLVDDDRIVTVKGKRIHVIGFDYHYRNTEYMTGLYKKLVSKEHLNGQQQKVDLRIILLHNPIHFNRIPQVDSVPTIVLSGHFHGGQFGLRAFPIFNSQWTVLRMSKMPDFGFYYQDAQGNIKHEIKSPTHTEFSVPHYHYTSNNPVVQYVHTGTGFYGVPLRLGTRNERGVLKLRIEPIED